MNVDVRRSLHPLRIRYAAPLLERIRAVWTWWSGELAELLPESLRDAIAARRQKLFVTAVDEGLELSLGSWADSRSLRTLPLEVPDVADGQLPWDAQQTILLLPAEKVLAVSLTLPLAAEENLREVLSFEMDQNTPFAADQVYFDYLLTGRDPDQQVLTLDLVYTPRSVVDGYCDALGAYGLELDVATSRGRDGRNFRAINLLPEERRRRRRIAVHHVNVALGITLAGLLVAAVALPIVQKNAALAELETQVQEAAADARDGNVLRRDLEKMADASRYLVEKKKGSLMTVQLIDEVSRILPDHTWVSRLDISATELQIQGQSEASAALIALIEASPYFENASFRSPVVQVSGTDEDRFHLSADIVRVEAP